LNTTAYIMNSYTGANCTGNIINPDSNVVPGNGRCIAGAGVRRGLRLGGMRR
jgi:hypothetical protein